MQSLLSADTRVSKCPTTTRTNLQGSTNSLAIVGDRNNSTRTRDAFASLIISIQSYNSPSFWYNLSSNNEGSLCQLLLLEQCIFHSILVKCGLIRRKVLAGEMATIIRNDAWTSFKSEYELDIEINKSKKLWKVYLDWREQEIDIRPFRPIHFLFLAAFTVNFSLLVLLSFLRLRLNPPHLN